MQDLQINFTQGNMAGEAMNYAVGSLVIGREPRPEPGQEALTIVGADGSISRNHATLADRAGDVILHNHSGNGTQVNGSLVMDEAVLKPGDVIGLGSRHSFTVHWQLVGKQAGQEQASPKEKASSVASSGLLGSPVVRALLVVYLAAILAVAAYLGWRGDGGREIRDDWPQLQQDYEQYQPQGLDEAEKLRRAEMAEAMLVRLRVLRANNRDREVTRLCQELMRLDADIRSPIYRYGAKCLGSLD